MSSEATGCVLVMGGCRHCLVSVCVCGTVRCRNGRGVVRCRNGRKLGLVSLDAFLVFTGTFPSFAFKSFLLLLSGMFQCCYFDFHCFSGAFRHFPIAFPMLFFCFPTLLLPRCFSCAFQVCTYIPCFCFPTLSSRSRRHILSRTYVRTYVVGAHFQLQPQAHSQS